MTLKELDSEELEKLTLKYGAVVPRYTSYPTAPEWKDEYSQARFEEAIRASNFSAKDYSLYLHLPFCESQCYYCGCNVVISKEHGIEKKYIDRIKEELKYYGDLIDKSRHAVQMAWGGGTPTFLSPEQILDLTEYIKEKFSLYNSADRSDYEYSIEIDPRVTSSDHLKAIWQAGFNRLSLGIQDFNLRTQEAINRIQSFELVESLMLNAREIGFTSINFDLIYGLPYQNLETFTKTIELVNILNPDRIALFNYAHIPSVFPFQKKYIEDSSLPDKDLKAQIFNLARETFVNNGYEFIGLDHFAKPDDSLSVAQKNKTLYRNFQGYTTHSGADLYGFGITAISDVQGVYKQNYKKLNNYYETIFGGDKFKISSPDDRERREIIKQIMCNGLVEFDSSKYLFEVESLLKMREDSLLDLQYLDNGNKLRLVLRDKGRFFIRNIASVFDTYIRKENSHKIFSTAL